jgi:NDP-sugar pyrophosphorylase family protein
MKALILAAGFGTAVAAHRDHQKPAIPFLNRPLISYSVEYSPRTAFEI